MGGGLLSAQNAAAIPAGSLLAIGASGSLVLGNSGYRELALPVGGGPPAGGSIQTVPEPAAMALLLAAAACGLVLRARRGRCPCAA